MNRVDVENQLLQKFHSLSVEKLEEILDFVLFVKHRIVYSNKNYLLNQPHSPEPIENENPLKNSIVFEKDIVAPIDEIWEANQ